MKHPELLYMFSMFENIALIAGVTYAAITFGNWELLWFQLFMSLISLLTANCYQTTLPTIFFRMPFGTPDPR